MKTHYYIDDIITLCTDTHLTVDEIFQYLQDMYPDIGRSSVYRNVEQLTEKGKLNKIIGIGKKAYFEANIGHHIHLIDKTTGDIIDLPIDCINFDKLPENFSIDNTDIKIYGTYKQD